MEEPHKRPSRPSIQFKAFTIVTIHITVIKKLNIKGSSNLEIPFIKGILMNSIFKPWDHIKDATKNCKLNFFLMERWKISSNIPIKKNREEFKRKICKKIEYSGLNILRIIDKIIELIIPTKIDIPPNLTIGRLWDFLLFGSSKIEYLIPRLLIFGVIIIEVIKENTIGRKYIVIYQN